MTDNQKARLEASSHSLPCSFELGPDGATSFLPTGQLGIEAESLALALPICYVALPKLLSLSEFLAYTSAMTPSGLFSTQQPEGL